MKLLMCLAFIALISCGKDGDDGAAGADGTDNKIDKLLVCEGPLTSIPSPGYWTGTILSYQRARMVGGDVTITASLRGSRVGSSVALYKEGMEGAKKGTITVSPEAGVFLLLEGPAEGASSPFLILEPNGTTHTPVFDYAGCKEY